MSSADFIIENGTLIEYTGSETHVVIPDGVTTIGCRAFIQNTHLVSVKIPNGVTKIDDLAFIGCSNLSSVEIPDSVLHIGERAFSGCKPLHSITLPDGIEYIWWNSFQDTDYYNNQANWDNDVLYMAKCLVRAKSSLAGSYKIKDGIKVISVGAFLFCDDIVSITIPDSITNVCDEAFDCCKNLTYIDVSKNNAFFSSVNGVLFNKDKSVLIKYPGNKNDTKYVIPDTVTKIALSAFKECKTLNTVVVPDGVTEIGDFAFLDCANLTSVTMPKGVKIGWNAFRLCPYLPPEIAPTDSATDYPAKKQVEPDNLIDLLGRLLAEIKQDNRTQDFIIENGTLIKYTGSKAHVVIPDGVTEIAVGAFSDANGLKSVVIPGSMQRITIGALGPSLELESVEIREGVQIIDEYAFGCCMQLQSIHFPASITRIKGGAFRFCISLKDVYYDGSESDWKMIDIDDDTIELKKATIHYNA